MNKRRSSIEKRRNASLPDIMISDQGMNVADDRYRLSIVSVKGVLDTVFSSTVSRDELRDLIVDLRKAMSNSVFAPVLFNGLTDDERAAELHKLASLGHKLYNGLFPPEQQAHFRNIVVRSTQTITILERAVHIPWEMLHPEPPSDTPSVEGFLGYQCFFVRFAAGLGEVSACSPFQVAGDPFKYGDHYDESSDKILLGHVFDDELPMMRQAEECLWFAPLTDKMDREPLTELSSDPDRRGEMNDIIAQFLLRGLDVVHFDCDAIVDNLERLPRTLSIQLFKGCRIQYQDTKLWRLNPRMLTVLFLNFCNSDATSNWSEGGVARRMVENGAHCVVGTLARVSDEFAHDFCSQFYQYALEPLSIGEALRRTRIKMSKTGNPTSLYYTLYGGYDHSLDVPARAVAA